MAALFHTVCVSDNPKYIVVCVDVGLDSLTAVLFPMQDDCFSPLKNDVLFTETLHVLFFDWLTLNDSVLMLQFDKGYTGLE